MTFYYQNQCEDVCYSPCNYGTVYNYQTYDCGSPCSYRSYRDCYPSYSYCYPSYSYCYPYSSRYTRRYSCYPRYPC
ncbi:hypothetical protein AV530_009262 [Patagioenas fasciata monilis]|uniref:Uncharacterized protein n=1 Tax=Patagioenas fasciata monilis TaxID=372326 RepID=A0A1V4KMM7_PATFA|nr:hypothetical protein AV530_009262 [Patagioenas fasciata monilis]